MSVELSINVVHPEPVVDAIRDIERALEELLNLSTSASVGLLDRGASAPSDAYAGRLSVGDDGEADVLTVEVPSSDPADDHGTSLVVVSAAGRRTATSFALMVAAAIALARRTGGTIIDDEHLLGEAEERTPSDVLGALRLSGPPNDLAPAAAILYGALPSTAQPRGAADE